MDLSTVLLSVLRVHVTSVTKPGLNRHKRNRGYVKPSRILLKSQL